MYLYNFVIQEETMQRNYKLQDLIDIKLFQSLQDRLNDINSFPAAIIDNDGKILTATAWQDVCTKFHRSNKECEKECLKSDHYIISHIEEANPCVSYTCPFGLTDNAFPIIIDGTHLANFFTGQFFLKEPDLTKYIELAKVHGFDENEYLNAVKKVPIWSEEQLKNYILYIKELIELLAHTGLQKLRELKAQEKILDAERKLSLSKYKNELHLQQTPIAVIEWDLNFQIVDWNQSAEKIFGYSKNEVIGRDTFFIVPEEIHSEIKGIFLKMAEQKETVRSTNKNYNKAGETIYCEWFNTALIDQNGELIGFASLVQDITERVEYEKKIEQREERFRKLIENAPDGISLLDKSNKISFASNSAFKILGYSENEIIGIDPAELTHPEDAPELIAKLIDLISKPGDSIVAEYRFKNKEGNWRLIESKITNLYNEPGIEALVFNFRDITERKDTEEALAKNEKLLNESLQIAKLGYYSFDIKKQTWTSNYILDEIFGIDENYNRDFIGWSKLIHEDFRVNMTNYVINNIITNHEQFDRQYKIIHQATGEHRWVHGKGDIDLDETGNVIRLYGTIRDISERMVLTEEIFSLKDRFESIFKLSPDPISISDVNTGVYYDVNHAFEELCGFDREEIIGSTAKDLDFWMESKDRKEWYKELVVNKIVNNIEYNIKIKNGDIIQCLISSKLITIENNAFAISIIKNITELRTAIDALSESEEKYRLLAEHVSDVIWVLDVTDNKFTYISPSIMRLRGLTVEEALNERIEDSLMPESAERVFRLINERLSLGEIAFTKTFLDEVHQRHKNGSVLDIEVTSHNVKNPKNGHYEVYGSSRDITSKKKAELSLIESEEKYKLLFESNKDGISIFYVHEDSSISNFIEVNDSAVKLLGYTKEEYLKLTPYDIEVPTSPEIVFTRQMKLQKFGYSNDETVLRDKHNNLIDVEITSIVIRYNNRLAIMDIIRDIAQRKAAQRELEESQQKYLSLYNDTPVMMHSIDKFGKLISVSNFWLDHLGYERNEVLGKKTIDFLTEESRKYAFEVVLPEFNRLGWCKDIQYQFVKKSGEVIDTLLSATSERDKNGEVLRSMAVIIDITQRKKAQAELLERETNYRGLFDTVKQAIYIQNPDMTFIDVNIGAEEMYGYKREEFLGRTPAFLGAPGLNDMDKINEYINLAYNGAPQKFEFWGLKKDGTIFPKDVWTYKGTYYGKEALLTLANDISDRKQYEKEILVAKEKAEESEKLKTSFLQNMSHEIRTPLNGIMGFTSLLKDFNNLSEEEIEQFINIISSSSQRLLGIVDDVLEISKLDTGLVKLRVTSFSIYDIFHYFYSLFNERINQKGLTFRHIVPQKLADYSITTDKDKLYQVFSNLINNATKFTDSGYIEFGCYMTETEFSFYVKDTGIGIDPDYKDKIFDRFFQYEALTDRKFGGTGLGLSISKAIANLLNAELTVESVFGKGSNFTISFPLSTISLTPNSDAKRIRRVSNFPDLSEFDILIVEDEDINYYYLYELLKKSKARISRVKNGADAIRLVSSNNFHLILMDLKMPVMNGFEATKQIKALKPNQIIIAQTAYSHIEEKSKAQDAGCDDFISKPIMKEDLLALVQRYLIK